MRTFPVLAAAALCAAMLASFALGREPAELRDAKTFDGIANKQQRSVALFEEAGKVIQHPRCLNCHPSGDRPMQGADMHPHDPPVTRGDANIGAPGMQCATCHGEKNARIHTASIQSMPGNPEWALAPRDMAWQGKTLGEICRQIKDPARNGGRTLAQLHAHMAGDALVGWGWDPGEGREKVPGTQKAFGELIAAWIDAGAACPD